jgi:hypothetical protein
VIERRLKHVEPVLLRKIDLEPAVSRVLVQSANFRDRPREKRGRGGWRDRTHELARHAADVGAYATDVLPIALPLATPERVLLLDRPVAHEDGREVEVLRREGSNRRKRGKVAVQRGEKPGARRRGRAGDGG